MCGDQRLQADIVKAIPVVLNAKLITRPEMIDWPAQLKAIKLIDELFPNQGILAACHDKLKTVDWAQEIIRISQEKSFSKNEKALNLRAIHQYLISAYPKDQCDQILKSIGTVFARTCNNPESPISWHERRDSIQLLINEFHPENEAMAPVRISASNIRHYAASKR